MLFERQNFFVAGLSRSGVSAAEYLVSRGARVYVYDDVQDEHVLSASDKLFDMGCVVVQKEELYERAAECDILVLSPGIPVDHPRPVAFRKAVKSIIG